MKDMCHMGTLAKEGEREMRLFWSWFPHCVCSSTTWKSYSLPKVIVLYLICLRQRGIHKVIVLYLICLRQRGIHSNFSKSKSLDSLEFVNLFWVWQIWWFWCTTLVTMWWNWCNLVNFGALFWWSLMIFLV